MTSVVCIVWEPQRNAGVQRWGLFILSGMKEAYSILQTGLQSVAALRFKLKFVLSKFTCAFIHEKEKIEVLQHLPSTKLTNSPKHNTPHICWMNRIREQLELYKSTQILLELQTDLTRLTTGSRETLDCTDNPIWLNHTAL